MKKTDMRKMLKQAKKTIQKLQFDQEYTEKALIKELKVTNETHKTWLFDYLYNQSFSTKEMINILNEKEHG